MAPAALRTSASMPAFFCATKSPPTRQKGRQYSARIASSATARATTRS